MVAEYFMIRGNSKGATHLLQFPIAVVLLASCLFFATIGILGIRSSLSCRTLLCYARAR